MIDRKTDIPPIDGTPVKRIILSIISDYDLKTGLCELIDNAIDQWSDRAYTGSLIVDLTLDVERQLITVRDNAGGVSRDNLPLLIAPGRSRNDTSAVIIGIFGVGGKRSAIALAEHTEIKTRFREEQTHELDITPTWLASDNWDLPAYAIPNIESGTTEVSLSHLRSPLKEADVDALRLHIGETYSWFLHKGCVIHLNGESVAPRDFESWAFPPDHPPSQVRFGVDLGIRGRVAVEITTGLIRDRIPEESNYGAYFYCNHRLIAKEIKNRDVGYFISGEAGVPHPEISLCRSIIRLEGPAIAMPWTSNKGGINFSHPLFQQLRPTIIQMTAHFSKLSRRFKDDWPGSVIQYDTGEISVAPITETPAGRRLILPDLPRETQPRGVRQARKNQAMTEKQPWTLGLVEALDAVDLIERYRLTTKNRFALILLDSNFEIALKEFIVHKTDLFPPHEYTDTRIAQLFRSRTEVIRVVRSKVHIPDDLIDIANHYYNARNKLIHERTTADVNDRDIHIYRSAVQSLLRLLFDLEFES
ncbi:MAG: ATP-binding protein [Candidatus Acidiferrales bacterium]